MSEIFGDMKTLSGGVLEVDPEIKTARNQGYSCKEPSGITPKKKSGGKKGKHQHQQYQQKQ